MVYQKSKVGQVLIYMQHRHMECDKLHIFHDLSLNRNVNYNAYSTPLLHEVLDVDHKMVMLVIGCITINFHIFVCNISIILNMILSVCPFSFTGSFSIFYLINEYTSPMLLRHLFLDFLAILREK